MQTELVEIQQVELAILDDFIHACERLKLRYYVVGGTLLGAVRHGGFIPWDDDIDVGMPRKDYDEFMRLGQRELEEHHFLQNDVTDPEYPGTYAKIRDSRTTFIESSVKNCNMNHGVYIDVFPLDGYPGRSPFKRLHKIAVYSLIAAIQRKLGIRPHRVVASAKELASRTIVGSLATLLSLKLLRKTLHVLVRQHDYDKSDFVINWHGAWGLREVMGRAFFGSGRPAAFDRLTVNVPDNSNAYLKKLYGDYMTLPPVEKRVGHRPEVIDLHAPYTTYTHRPTVS